jgi:hypothetical protein
MEATSLLKVSLMLSLNVAPLSYECGLKLNLSYIFENSFSLGERQRRRRGVASITDAVAEGFWDWGQTFRWRLQ